MRRALAAPIAHGPATPSTGRALGNSMTSMPSCYASSSTNWACPALEQFGCMAQNDLVAQARCKACCQGGDGHHLDVFVAGTARARSKAACIPSLDGPNFTGLNISRPAIGRPSLSGLQRLHQTLRRPGGPAVAPIGDPLPGRPGQEMTQQRLRLGKRPFLKCLPWRAQEKAVNRSHFVAAWIDPPAH